VEKENDPLSQDDVVIIEERDKRTIVYIAIAAVLGLAIGGLAGSIVTKGKWQNAYSELSSRYREIENQKQQVVVEQVLVQEQQSASIDKAVNERVTEELDVLKHKFQQELRQSQTLVTELEKINIELEQRITAQETQIKADLKELSELSRQTDMQAAVLERSRELFQRELTIKQRLEVLLQEREALTPKVRRYKKECDIYLEGKSWEASSKSCDKQDEINSELSQMDQMIEVHKLDLREIQQIADRIGL